MENNRHKSRPAPSFLPATAVLEMTYRCNHTCQFCSCPWYGPNFETFDELTTDEWKKIIEKLCEMGICNIAFTGGEPLLKEDIHEIIAFAADQVTEHIETEKGSLVSKKLPPKLYLLTNGKNLTKDTLLLCKKNNINLSISLPGLKAFPELTGNEDPQNVLYWFKEAKKMSIPTTVGVTVTTKNINELYETIAEALIAGADTLLMNRFLPGGRGIQYEKELMLTNEQITLMLDTAEEVLQKANRKGSVGTELPKCLIDTKKYSNLEVGTQCSAALDFFVIGPSGYIRVCNHSPVRLNHVTHIEDLKNHQYWKRFITKDYLPKACFSCKEMAHCDGGCREAAHICGGSLDSLDPAMNENEILLKKS